MSSGTASGPESVAALAVRSPLVALLALLAAVYIAAAAYHAIVHAANGPGPAFAVAAAVLAATLLLARIGFRGGAWFVLLVVFAAQLNWSGWVGPQPMGDLATLWDQARRLAASWRAGEPDLGLIVGSASPSALAVYGGAIAVVSDDLSVLRVISAGLWTLQAWFVWRIARLVSESRGVATLSAALYGLSPTVVVYGALPSVDAVFGALSLGSVYVLLSYRRRGLVRSAALSGLLAGLALLARPIGLGHIVGLTLIMALAIGYLAGARPKLRMAQALVGFWLGVGAATAPLAAAQWLAEGAPRLGPSVGLGYELYIGTDRSSGGAYSEAVSPRALEAVGYAGPGARPPAEADALAWRAAVRRIADDPLGVAALASTDKMARVWESQTGLLAWSEASARRVAAGFDASAATGRRAPTVTEARAEAATETWLFRAAPAALDGALIALLLAAALGAARLALRFGAVLDPTRWVLLLIVFLAVATAVGLFEARDRNAFALAPFLALLAPMAAARLPEIAGSRRAVRATAARAPAAATEAPGSDRFGDTDPRPLPESGAPTVDPDAPVTDRLAHALAGMSKPPRRGGGPS